jgi:hypothetical protein
MTRYYKQNTITTKPVIPNVINPTQETIIDNGWYIYIDTAPSYDADTQKILKTDVVIDGQDAVQQYVIIDLTPEEIRERTVPQTITNGQGKLQLYALGIYEQVEAMILMAGNEEKIYWNDWDTWRRDSPIINRLAPMIWPDDTEQLLDQFFIEASKIS